MNLIKIIKKIALVAAIACLLLPEHGYSQLVNNGGSITVMRDAILYASQSFTNSSGGVIINDGATIANSDIVNDSSAALSGNGTYSIKGSFVNAGTYNSGLSVLNFFGIGNSALQNKSGTIYTLQMNKAPNWVIDMLDSETVTGDVSFGIDSNWIRLNNSSLTLGAGCHLYNYDETRYFITNGSGVVKKMNVNNTSFTFPVGYDPDHYNPLTITEKGTADDYSVRSLEHALLKGSSGNAISSGGIDASWEVKEATPGSANTIVEAEWKTTDELSGFDYTHCMVTKYNGTKWDYQANKAAAATGSPYRSISRSNLANFGYFTVLSKSNPSFTGTNPIVEKEALPAIQMKSMDIKVYPTMTHSYVMIEVRNNDNSIRKMNISVVDQNGRIVLQKQNADVQTQKLALSNLASGFYTVLVTFGNNKFTQKIIVGK